MKHNTPPPVTHTFTVPDDLAQIRLDHFIADLMPTMSRSHIQRLAQLGNVTVNGAIVQKSGYALKPGDTVILTIPSKPPLGAAHDIPEGLEVPIVFEHPDFFIINKPAGLLVHATSLANTEFSLVDWLIHKFKDIIHVGDQDRPGIVHRLDKDTSGLMVITRNDTAHTLFGRMFHDRTIHKKYYAIVKGHTDQEGTIDLPIGRHQIHRNRMTTQSDKGRNAVTHYTVKSYFANATLLNLSPVTGRTHQIRVHCAAIGHPIIGDAVYGTTSKLIKRQALHAYHLDFNYKGEDFSFTIGLPEDMQKLVDSLAPAPE